MGYFGSMNCIPRSSPGAVLFIIQMWVIAGLLPREGWESNRPIWGRNYNIWSRVYLLQDFLVASTAPLVGSRGLWVSYKVEIIYADSPDLIKVSSDMGEVALRDFGISGMAFPRSWHVLTLRADLHAD